MGIYNIEWSDALSVNNEIIDEQHRQLFNLYNEFCGAYLKNEHYEKLSSTLDQMTEYAVHHFQAEEQFFKGSDDSEIANHLAEHTEFIIKLGELKIDWNANSYILAEKLISFLQHWLVDHITSTDKQFFQHYNQQL